MELSQELVLFLYVNCHVITIKASAILLCWPPWQMSLLLSELACSSGTLARWGCCVFHNFFCAPHFSCGH